MGLGGGLGHPNVEVSFALSPKVCLTLGACPTLPKCSDFGGVRTLHHVAIVDPEPNVCVGVFAIPNVGQAPRP